MARDPDAPCDRTGCVADLPEGQSLSIVLDRAAFEEDCARAEVVVSPLTAPADCAALIRRAQAGDERRGGLDWDGTRFVVAADRAALEDRPWSPAPKRPRGERVVRPGQPTSKGPTRPIPAKIRRNKSGNSPPALAPKPSAPYI